MDTEQKMPDLPDLPSASDDVMSLEQAITNLTVLAQILDEQVSPLFSPVYPDIMLDPHQMARLVRLFFMQKGPRQ